MLTLVKCSLIPSFGLMTIFLLVGCGDSGVAPLPTADVRGSVDLDGKPMPEGEITFVLAGNVPDTLQVRNGSYEGKAKIGICKVEVRCYRPGKKNEMYPNEPPSKENYIPAKFNSESTLKADVKAGKNEYSFKVTSR